jgi:hypothetical protein
MQLCQKFSLTNFSLHQTCAIVLQRGTHAYFLNQENSVRRKSLTQSSQRERTTSPLRTERAQIRSTPMHYGTALRLYTNDGSEQHTPCNGIRLPALSPLVGCLLSIQCTSLYTASTPQHSRSTPVHSTHCPSSSLLSNTEH